jgi:hypothetical protein
VKNIGEEFWIPAADADGKLRVVVVDRWPSQRLRDGCYEYEMLYSVRERDAISTRHEEELFSNQEEAQAAFERLCKESQRRSELLAATLEDRPPTIGDELIDRLIEAAWQHGHQVACAEEGVGDSPTSAAEIRELAKKLLNRSTQKAE